jgi:hypothetical protein
MVLAAAAAAKAAGRRTRRIIVGNHKATNPYQPSQHVLHRHYSSGSNNNNKTTSTILLDHTVATSRSMISYSTLQLQNATTSNAIIDHYASNASFQKLQFEGDSTIQRDKEDDNKLAKGIAFAQQKGVLDPKHVPQPYTEIDVLGKTPKTWQPQSWIKSVTLGPRERDLSLFCVD